LIENRNAIIDEFKKINKRQKKIGVKPSSKMIIILGVVTAVLMLIGGIVAIFEG
jgi:hypothetical protein